MLPHWCYSRLLAWPPAAPTACPGEQRGPWEQQQHRGTELGAAAGAQTQPWQEERGARSVPWCWCQSERGCLGCMLVPTACSRSSRRCQGHFPWCLQHQGSSLCAAGWWGSPGKAEGAEGFALGVLSVAHQQAAHTVLCLASLQEQACRPVTDQEPLGR